MDPALMEPENKFTVKDIMRMLKHGLYGDMAKMKFEGVDMNKEDLSRMKELQTVLQCEQILAELEKAENMKRPVQPKRSWDIIDKGSDSPIDVSYWAVNEDVFKEKEELVDYEVYQQFLLRLKGKAVANSTFKKPPRTHAPPPPTHDEKLQEKSMKQYFRVYGNDKPRPNYPILPPRERPPPPPPPEPKKSKKNKGKGKKKKEPPPPINVTEWRKENLPVFSTRLWMPFFRALSCHQRTPNLSNPPTPPAGVPEPLSMFGYFIELMESGDRRERPKMTGHYSPNEGSSSNISLTKDKFHQPMEEFPPEYQTVLELERAKSIQYLLSANQPPRPEYLHENNFFKKYDHDSMRQTILDKMSISTSTIHQLADEDYVVLLH